MNCDAVRRRLLADDHPDRPSDDARRHLAGCPACRQWSQRLAQIEQQIPMLPVPPSSAREAFVRQFQQAGGPVVQRVPLPWPTPVKERGLQKLSVAVAIAAALAVFTLIWWSWPHNPAIVTQPSIGRRFEAERDRRDQIVALAAPRQRVEKLAELAADLQDKARTLAQAGKVEELDDLTTFYTEVVGDDLVAHAASLPAAERPAVLQKVAVQLGEAQSAFNRLATEKPGASTAKSLQALAVAAREGGQRIQALLKAA